MFNWLILADAVWESLSPSNILMNQGDSAFFAGIAKTFFAVDLIAIIIGAIVAIIKFAMGGKNKGEGKDLLVSKIVAAIIVASGVGILDAIFLTANHLW